MRRSRRRGQAKRGWLWTAHLLVGGLCFFFGVMILRSISPASPEVLLSGTALSVRVLRPVSSQTAQLGDVFEARVESAQGTNGPFAVPARVRVQGRCVAVRASEGEGRPGYLRLVLSGLTDGQGHVFALETTTVSLSGNRTLDLTGPAPGNSARSGMHTDLQPLPGNSGEAVVTPDMRLTFVLLKPAVIPARH